MTMEISKGILTNVLEQFLVIDRSDKFNTRILVKTSFLTQLVVKFVFFNIGNEYKVLVRVRCHKATNHSLIVIFRHKTSYNKVIIIFNDTLFKIPCANLIINLSQSRFSCICPIGNVGCLRTIFRIILLNIRFNVFTITNQKICMFNHELLRNFPIFTNWKTPFRTKPFMTIWVNHKGTTDSLDFLFNT